MENNVSLFSPFDSLFDLTYKKSNPTVMKTNLSYDQEEYLLTMEVPGYSKEEIEIETYGKKLVITLNKGNKETKPCRFLLKEITDQNPVSRSFLLPQAIDENSVLASLKEGILAIKCKPINTKKKVLIN